MGKIVNLIGERFSRLTVTSKAGKTTDRKTLWNCQCDCGEYTEVRTHALLSGKTKSCGCIKREQTSKACRKDLKGQKFGKLTALHIAFIDSRHRLHWNCVCECGNTKVIRGTSLTYGTTTSCGCLRAAKPKEPKHKQKKHPTKTEVQYKIRTDLPVKINLKGTNTVSPVRRWVDT